MKKILISCIAFALTSAALFAGTVTTLNDSGPGSLREAIADAAPGDTITFAVTGTINLSASGPELLINKNLTVAGPGAALLTVRRPVTIAPYRIFHITAGTVTISGLTISGGRVSFGGGISNESTLTLINCTVSGNFASGPIWPEGGGIYNSGTLNVTNCNISGNSAYGSGDPVEAGGGGIFNYGGVVTLNSSIISGNVATGGGHGGGSGGGIESPNGVLNVTNCIISDNTAGGGDDGWAAGGGIDNAGIGTLSDSTVSDNSVIGSAGDAQGGGIFNSEKLTVSHCSITGNSVSGGGNGPNFGHAQGGGIFNMGYPLPERGVLVVNSTITGNSAIGVGVTNDGGGGILNIGSGMVQYSTITGNSSYSYGGGIRNISGNTTSLRSSIVAGNNAPVGPDCSGSIISDDYNLIQDISGCSLTGVTVHNLVGVSPMLGPLQDNGGPTFTYALLPGSPAIDKGICADSTDDQRGAPRPFDDPSIVNANDGCDIGAFERTGVPQLISAVSRKAHGSAGTFDIDLPLTGEPGVECRSGGGNYALRFTFDHNVVSGSASVTSGIGTLDGNPGFNANRVSVRLTGVTDVQKITVTLSNVTDEFAQVLPSAAVSVNMLIGDTTGNKTVNAADVAQTKGQSGQAVSSVNFREDVAISGTINSSDIGLVKSKAGGSLP